MTREERIKELINKYNEWDKIDDGSKSMFACVARDNKRQISKKFEKEIHESIEKFLKRY